jgi:hypothetical protein
LLKPVISFYNENMNKFIHILISAAAPLTFGLLFALTCNQAYAATSPVSLGILPPIQFPASDYNVTGLRVSALWGEHRDVSGIDVGLLGNITDGKFAGIGVSGLVNYTKGETTITGLQFAGLANINKQKTTVAGVQAALVNANTAADSVAGLQIGLVNLSEHTDIYGFQVGAYNVANSVHGFQIGIVNVVQNLHGLQIGLVNVNHTGLFYVSPILNFGF